MIKLTLFNRGKAIRSTDASGGGQDNLVELNVDGAHIITLNYADLKMAITLMEMK